MTIDNKHVVALNYILHTDGENEEKVLVEKSDVENPLTFLYGVGMMIPKFEENIKGLTTGDKASFTILPEILDCKEFVNADEIAKGLSPFQPEKVAFEAGRIMLNRIDELFKNQENFAFETTLATKTYKQKIKFAKEKVEEIRSLGINVGKGTVEYQKVKEEDWANNWKKYYKPIKIGEKIIFDPNSESFVIRRTERSGKS